MAILSPLQTGLLPDQVEGFDPLREFAVDDGGFTEIGQGRTVPVLTGRTLKELDEIVNLDHIS